MAIRYEPQTYIHGSKLARKAAAAERDRDGFRKVLASYQIWKESSLAIANRTEADVRKLTDLLNDYKNSVEGFFDARPNSAQEVLQPSIIEEFFEYLFCTLEKEVGEELLRKPGKAYIDLVFNPSCLSRLVTAPEITIRRKDHDFIIGAVISLGVSGGDEKAKTVHDVVVPAIAIECKRYLERNMLDECSGTAEKVKRATPYCKYFVVSEFLKMDNASPELSLIDEIYVLRKQRNSDRLADDFIPNPISYELIWDLYRLCIDHLKRIWWDPESAISRGKVFNFK